MSERCNTSTAVIPGVTAIALEIISIRIGQLLLLLLCLMFMVRIHVCIAISIDIAVGIIIITVIIIDAALLLMLLLLLCVLMVHIIISVIRIPSLNITIVSIIGTAIVGTVDPTSHGLHIYCECSNN